MKKKILIGSIIAVAIIVLSSFSSVVGKVSSDNELVELEVEFCGLGKKHTVSLTQQETDEVELLFDDMEQRLSEVETREQAEEIFKDAVVELDKYGLLGGMSIRFAQNLVTGKFSKLFHNEIQQESHIPIEDEIHNSNCLILGKSLMYTVSNPSNYINSLIWDFLYSLPPSILFLIWVIIMHTFFNLKPLHLNCDLSFGAYGPLGIGQLESPSRGAIFTIGDRGIRTFTGEFYGNLYKTPWLHLCVGAKGFTGIKILTNYIGFASEVGLQQSPPDI